MNFGSSIMTNIKKNREQNTKNFKYIDLFFNNVRKPFFIFFMGIHIIYFIILIGLFSINLDYVNNFNRYINYIAQIFISFYLLFRFNPFRNYECNKNDSIVIFWSALFLLFNLGVIRYIEEVLLRNPQINKIYNETKGTYESKMSDASDYLKKVRQNLFNGDTENKSPDNKNNDTPSINQHNNTHSESNPSKQPNNTPSADKPKDTPNDKTNMATALISTDTTVINNNNNELKFVKYE
jgi:hypothetical protein